MLILYTDLLLYGNLFFLVSFQLLFNFFLWFLKCLESHANIYLLYPIFPLTSKLYILQSDNCCSFLPPKMVDSVLIVSPPMVHLPALKPSCWSAKIHITIHYFHYITYNKQQHYWSQYWPFRDSTYYLALFWFLIFHYCSHLSVFQITLPSPLIVHLSNSRTVLVSRVISCVIPYQKLFLQICRHSQPNHLFPVFCQPLEKLNKFVVHDEPSLVPIDILRINWSLPRTSSISSS